MNKQRKALELALNTLKPWSTPDWAGTGVDEANAAISAIRDALAEPDQATKKLLTESQIIDILHISVGQLPDGSYHPIDVVRATEAAYGIKGE